ncbi:ribosome assembly RNA-binding protein YhbY [Marinospirillum alkaliphilum]|uniref:RNA-binding protein n=1 Tax=Marinospirillum alkaliphilum DSM 21637 TaxID=1122209 RepID=A0A1K1Y6K2_9GAMM|nr:ribosome assembly RNA-binding protein YhbY [Marinospirillum alkaliphilum]SFX57366.1 RNA-binding protein [Marinospirillum alkaliphilum DSM 21637]
MSLKGAQKKELRSIGHHLNPVVLVSENGLSEGLIKEADRALNDHELIKIRFSLNDREERLAMMNELATKLGAEVVQTIGKIGLFLRRAQKPNPKLSNLLRFAEH